MKKKFLILLPKFFGPTFLLKKSNYVNDIYRWCGCRSRCPQNKIARDLIYLSGVPICAPSANIGGKVSSTTFNHVHQYFKDNNQITIIKDTDPCLYGIESTMLKLIIKLTKLRRFIISQDIENALKQLSVQTFIDVPMTQTVNPGSDINHYQIDKNVVLANFMADDNLNLGLSEHNIMKTIDYYLMNSIFVDFGGNNRNLVEKFYGYVDLSEKGDPKEALFNLYNVLHH